MRRAGYHWLLLDLEHCALSLPILTVETAAALERVDSIAAVPGADVVRRHMQAGVRFVLAGLDLTAMAQAATQQAEALSASAKP